MTPIVIATANPHKVAELRAILAAAGIPAIGLNDLPGPFHEPAEHGTTFEANAAIKSLSYTEQTGRACLADDSGLEVDALRGAPGVISSHYSTDGRETGLSRANRDAANNARLLRDLEGVPVDHRSARFVCVMCLAAPGSQRETGEGGIPPPVSMRETGEGGVPPTRPAVLATSRATFEGRIGLPNEVPRGRHGFGYDPLFLVAPQFSRTSAELAPDEKNNLSHRAAAARQMADSIRSLRLP